MSGPCDFILAGCGSSVIYLTMRSSPFKIDFKKILKTFGHLQTLSFRYTKKFPCVEWRVP